MYYVILYTYLLLLFFYQKVCLKVNKLLLKCVRLIKHELFQDPLPQYRVFLMFI